MYDNNSPNNGQTSSTPKDLSFDIRDHLDKLLPGKEKNKFICPVCDGHNLGIDPKTGKYRCFTSECASTDIREAIRPWAEVEAERGAAKGKSDPRQPKKKAKPPSLAPVPLPAGLQILRLPAPQQAPEPTKPTYIPPGVPASAVLITYSYSDSQQVLRYEWSDPKKPKGRDKTHRQVHLDSSGKQIWTKGDLPWSAYRLDEVIERLKDVPDGEPIAVLMLEGERNVEIARGQGIAALTMQGSKWSQTEIQAAVKALQLTGKNVALVKLRDNDGAGVKKGTEVQVACNNARLPCLVIDPTAIYPDIPEKGDIREILEAMEAEEFLIRVNAEIIKATNPSEFNNFLTSHPRTCECVVCLSSFGSISDYIPDTAPAPEQSYVQKAVEALYSRGHWASVAGQLLEFTGTHYTLRLEATEKRRILDWLSTYSELVRGKYRCTRANTASVNEVYSYILLAVAVDPNTINPDGLNSSSGVVKINPDGSHSLVPHDPKQVYTYIGCKYDPDIDPTDCDRLLECLEPSQREIFLRTAAAALNLKLVRSKLTGRGVKGLLCHGEGSNGKDTLRAVLAAVYGNGMTGRSLSDFKSYDMGRKFALAGIEGSICNWASENTAKVDLDNIQSLKQFITGDPLDIERKGKDSYEYKSAAVFFANCNKLPSITGGTAAIDNRYGILRFDKTYARNAIASEGQLEADPRFKDDEKFILEQIAPALLNKMLERLPLLLAEGIDYAATREAMREAQEESRHLWQFVRDLGYEAGKGERVYAKDLWSELQEWYQEAGILELEYSKEGKEKLVWNDLPNQWDKPVKAINQLYARLCEIFPKLEKHRHTERGFESQQTTGSFYYLGIAKQKPERSGKTASASSAVDAATISSSAVLQQEIPAEALLKQTILTQSAAEDAEALNPNLLDLCNTIAKLNPSDKQKLTELLTGLPCSDPLKAFKVGDNVAGNSPDRASYNWHGRIVEIYTSISCKVDWQEREGMKGGRIISMLFCDLRKI